MTSKNIYLVNLSKLYRKLQVAENEFESLMQTHQAFYPEFSTFVQNERCAITLLNDFERKRAPLLRGSTLADISFDRGMIGKYFNEAIYIWIAEVP